MYHPKEDSFLLKKYVKKYSKGIVLDIGTGSGIQALTAAKNKKVTKVFAVDIDEEALAYCIKNINNKKIIFLKSNLFSFFKLARHEKHNLFEKNFNLKFPKQLKFDTIIFNPPYLPKQEPKDKAIDGGKKGYELIQKFLREAKDFLKPKGIILLVFSSLTNKEKIDHILLKYNYSFNLLEKKHIFFEDIFCYKISFNKRKPYK